VGSNRMYRDRRTGQLVSLANLSAYHPDFGMHPAQHAEQKVKRAAGKVDFIPKADLRAKRSGLFGGMFRGR
jgi:hypothetical protein